VLPDSAPRLEEAAPTVVERMEGWRWIHVALIGAMSLVAILLSEWLSPHKPATYQAHHLLYLLPLPYVVLAIWGLLTPRWTPSDEPAGQLGQLILCVVTKGTNAATVRRTRDRLVAILRPGVELCVVTDRPLDFPHLLVPEDFRTRHARYKARALEYFRQQRHFGPHDWVLHLDEESVLDERGLEACLDYCRRSPYLYGQGPIFYNNHDFWRHPVLAAADCIRAADDVAKFHLQLARLHRPIFGLHGSFLLAKGTLEDEITWDLPGSLVEDYAFAVECMRRGYGVGEIGGIVREQSPHSIGDLLRQRRRWLVGIRGLSRLSPWARLWSVLWSLSPLVKMATVIDVPTSTDMPLPLVATGAFFACTFLYLYVLGSVLQDLDACTRTPTLLKRAVVTALLFPVSFTLESTAVLWSLVSRERRIGFQIIRK
jgi:hypothetical protein